MAWAADPAAVFGYVKKNCVMCHNAKVKNGDLDLAQYKETVDFDTHREAWERVVSKVKTGEMPPAGMPKPPAADSTAVIGYLEGEFARQDREAKPDPGRVTARRLNKAEYNNTVRDLLGVDIAPAADFPADESAYGFDNIADALGMSPVLVEKYLHAAERSVRWAVFGPPKMKPAMIHYPTPVRINDVVTKPTLPPDMFHYDETGLSTRHSAHIVHRFPVDGEYEIQFTLNGHRPNQSMPARPALYIDGKFVKEWEYDATDLEGQIVTVRTQVTAGEHLISATYLKNYHGLPPSYKGPEPSTREEVALINTRGKLTEKDIETLRKYGTKIKTDRLETRIDNRFESIDIGGPFTQPLGPSEASRKMVFVCGAKTTSCAGQIVAQFARRAFRRPVGAAETAPFVKLYELARQAGDSFEEGVATALQGVMVSPHFLYRIERDPAGAEIAPVNPYELASRLSYFLWSSMPDEGLLTLAGQGKLREPAVLQAQVKRMLADGRSRALVENFVGQWLQYKNIDVVRPDVEKFPEFEDSLRLAMKRETELFFEDMFRKDGHVLETLDAGHTYVNERLARFYGIEGVTGPEFRRVDMRGTKRGGGVLAQGSVLTVSSYSTRTSPVLRGKWILENLLNAPPPPPPPGVPPLEDTNAGPDATLRQQMEAHRKNAVCASCHSRMDPLGFGLENLNAVGAWRVKDGNAAVDASGQLPSGETFEGPAELKKLLLADKESYTKGLAEKLLTYAMGRGLERYDKPAIARIAAQTAAGEYKFSALALAVVNSLPFQQRRAAPVTGVANVGGKTE
jgi:PAS domain-containing protein